MLAIKEIVEKFEVSRATLHNWKTTKPKLYDYLKNYDGKNDEFRDMKIVMEKYICERQGEFDFAEIEFLLGVSLVFENLDTVKNLQNIFIDATAKEIKTRAKFILELYGKLEKLNIIEKYMFVCSYKSVQNQLKKTREDRGDLIRYYFKTFLIPV